MNLSPTQLTIRELRKRGMTAAVVERWNSDARTRQELFGIANVLGIGANITLAIQVTTDSNLSVRASKIAESKYIGAARNAGWSIEVWGWKKVKNRWRLHVVDVH